MRTVADLRPVAAYSDALGEAFFAVDKGWRIVVVNDAALAFAGLAREDVIGRDFWELFPLSRGSVFAELYRRAMESGDLQEVEAETQLRPGRFMRGVALPLDDGLAITLRDVTAQRLAAGRRERQLEESESRLRLALDATQLGTWDFDPQTGSLTWDEQCRAIHGLAPDAPVTYEVYVAGLHPDDRDGVVANAQRALDPQGSGQLDIEHRIRRAGSGEERWVRGRGRAFFADGRAVRLIGTVLDITDGMRSEAALRESEQRLRATYEHAGVGIVETDAEGRLLRVNEAICAIVGYSRDELLCANPFNLTHPDDVAEDRALYARQIAGEIDAYTVEKRVIRKGGRSLWTSVSSSAVRGPDGAFLYAVRVTQDIDERRRAEDRRSLLIHELNHRVKNTLATVQSIATQTLRGVGSAERAREDIEGRLLALSRAHDVLTRESWEGANLAELVAQALEPYGGPALDRVAARGPDVRLPPRMALALAMALQELATNAAKYGALSNAVGRVELDWNVSEGAAPRLALRWSERGGPPVRPPKRRGFGSKLIERSVSLDLAGKVVLAFDADGVVCTVDVPIETGP
jgi:PAS domain S-box-containing protein